MGSFREEFFPWLCKVQYQRIKRNKYDRSRCCIKPSKYTASKCFVAPKVLSPASIALSQSTALRHSTLQPITHEHASATFSPTASPYLGTMALSAPPSVTDSDNEDAVPMSLRIGVVIHKATDGYVARANNLQSFLSLSRHVCVNSFVLVQRSNDDRISFLPTALTRYRRTPKIVPSSTRRQRSLRIP